MSPGTAVLRPPVLFSARDFFKPLLDSGFNADVLRMKILPALQRVGETIHIGDLVLQVVRVLIAFAVAESLHQARRRVPNMQRYRFVTIVSDFFGDSPI